MSHLLTTLLLLAPTPAQQYATLLKEYNPVSGGMRAGHDFRLLSSFEYIFGREFQVQGSLGNYRFYESVNTRAYMITAGLAYLIHLKSYDLGLEARLGMLESMIEFSAADDLWSYYLGGELSGSRLCFLVETRLERYFSPNFSVSAALGYRYARLTKVIGYLSTGEPIALAKVRDVYGERLDIASEYYVKTLPEISYAEISFGGPSGKLGLEVHY